MHPLYSPSCEREYHGVIRKGDSPRQGLLTALVDDVILPSILAHSIAAEHDHPSSP